MSNRRKNGAAKQVPPRAEAAALDLPSVGFARLPTVLAVFPVSRSTWWAGVASGRFPKAVKLGAKTTAWKVEDIRALIARESQQS